VRGASSLLMTMLMGTVLTGGLGAVDAAAAVSAQAHAQSAADAVAHAAAALILGDPDRDRLSIAVQANAPCDTDEKDASAAGPGCARALAAARDAAAENRSVLLRLLIGPDPRDLRETRGPGRVLVQAHVAVARGLPLIGSTCPARPGSGPDLCWAEAWSAAQGAG
jgi:hypothetical protein